MSSHFVLWEVVSQTKYCCSLKIKHFAPQDFRLATPLLKGSCLKLIKMRGTPFLSFSCWIWIFLWLQMLNITLNKGDFYQTPTAYRLALIDSTCSSNRQAEVKVTHANTPTPLLRFKNVIYRHHYVMQKNSSCIETEQRYLCRVLHFNRQNLMLISPPND